MISTRSAGLLIDTVVCLTLAKWETVSGRFGGYLRASAQVTAPGQKLVTPNTSAPRRSHVGADTRRGQTEHRLSVCGRAGGTAMGLGWPTGAPHGQGGWVDSYTGVQELCMSKKLRGYGFNRYW